MRNILIAGAIALPLILIRPACAEVTDSAPTGFAVRETVHIKVAPDAVYDALLHPARWWNPQHTFSGDPANLSLDAKAGGCLCEAMPHGGSVLHLTVVFADPGKTLRLRGPMGPFQAQGVDSALTFTLKPEPGGTLLVLDNRAGGYMQGGFAQWPQAADGMLADLAARLAKYSETGHPN